MPQQNDALLNDYGKTRYLLQKSLTAETPYLGSGAAFPTTPYQYQRYYRQDWRTEFINIDGTSTGWRQLSEASFDTLVQIQALVSPPTGLRAFALDYDMTFYYTGSAWAQVENRLVVPAAKIRVLNDTTTRAAGYSNTAVQVTGVGGIPTFAKSVFVIVTHIGTAAGNAVIVLDNPDSPTGATVISSYISASGNYITAMSQVSLSTLGKLSYTIIGSSVGYSHFIIDVASYVI